MKYANHEEGFMRHLAFFLVLVVILGCSCDKSSEPGQGPDISGFWSGEVEYTYPGPADNPISGTAAVQVVFTDSEFSCYAGEGDEMILVAEGGYRIDSEKITFHDVEFPKYDLSDLLTDEFSSSYSYDNGVLVISGQVGRIFPYTYEITLSRADVT